MVFNLTIKYLKSSINIPIIVGGGISTPNTAKKLIKSGAGYIVSGSQIEKLPTINDLNKLN